MKQKLICLLVVLLGCSLLASPNRTADHGSTCSNRKMITVPAPVANATVEVADDLELILPMHQLVNSLL
jgi:hypothetical protein